ncbi:hypothetical protein [Macrococcus armenti]|uniref:hypothetical protein n=1 Tax=Macrococcus armenti TaxID=2875764 RepID=UPI001CCFCCA2|nr:hypothetical protein [Macrococcus armenti]UBH14849.1 hypothetical protein LAU44_08775 [Macrococcus armenti]UBH17209.1 hypothetical protein LAU39_08805 [Macrococcus armenti]UBH19474.1 hypothetical protein LAU40_08785 [Macrococcus armenti]
MDKEKVNKKLLEGIYNNANILVQHKGAVLERDNLDSLVNAYAVINNVDTSADDFKKTLKETFNL